MTKLSKPRSSKGLAVLCARIAEDKLAHDTLILELSKIEVAQCDYFVICSCDSDVQVRAIADEIQYSVKKLDFNPPRMEGLEASQWVILDFFDVVVHIMLKSSRNYYKLEKLWADSQFMHLNEKAETRVYNRENLKKLFADNVLE